MGPVICLITPPAAPASGGADDLVARIAEAARAGVHLIQIRQPQLEGRALNALVEQSVAAARGTRARVLVNDRLDVALAAGAHGVHLRGDSMPAARVRAVAPHGFLIGRSVHAADEAAAVARAGGLDYLIFGPVFATASKPGAAPAGTAALAEVCTASSVPVLAVGGVAPHCLGAVAAAGAAGFAAIGLFTHVRCEAVPAVVDDAVRAFDTPTVVP